MINEYANERRSIQFQGCCSNDCATIHLCYYLLVLHQKELKVLLSVLVENLEGVSCLDGKTTDTKRGSH